MTTNVTPGEKINSLILQILHSRLWIDATLMFGFLFQQMTTITQQVSQLHTGGGGPNPHEYSTFSNYSHTYQSNTSTSGYPPPAHSPAGSSQHGTVTPTRFSYNDLSHPGHGHGVPAGPGQFPPGGRPSYDPYNPYNDSQQATEPPSYNQTAGYDEDGGYDPYARDDPYRRSDRPDFEGGLNGSSPAPYHQQGAGDYNDYSSINR